MALQKKNYRNELKRLEVRRMTHEHNVSRPPNMGSSRAELRALAEIAVFSHQSYGPNNKIPL